ncbi:MAG: hypothetical protein QM809_01180 [Gordonia sp. (in: high G+C Gram-positive bacteria)]|uniref:hypothetical protein n=1 Tax=Gordonia sp. (in: high G+C Gram-positive bacteria) TaxID=84139 RepID=UPI0039E46824
MKQLAWIGFDRIVADAAPDGRHTDPWSKVAGRLEYQPDYTTLCRLLGVPLALKVKSQSGVPALAIDVWISYELRRAGFDPDSTWPRAAEPRVLPAAVSNLLAALPKQEREALRARLARKSIAGVTASSANILGKNYTKQVDVVMSDWATGPELLVSTKRMDSSYGKNAANRVEESYGDAKNLRLRHPLAALGFVFGLRSDILTKEPDTAEWLIDLLQKLGREDDAYHATCLLMISYDDALATVPDASDSGEGPIVEAGPAKETEAVDVEAFSGIEQEMLGLFTDSPPVILRHDVVPAALDPARFLQTMVERILDTTPVDRHKEARRRRRAAQG